MFCDQGWKVLKAWCCYYGSSLTVSLVGKALECSQPPAKKFRKIDLFSNEALVFFPTSLFILNFVLFFWTDLFICLFFLIWSLPAMGSVVMECCNLMKLWIHLLCSCGSCDIPSLADSASQSFHNRHRIWSDGNPAAEAHLFWIPSGTPLLGYWHLVCFQQHAAASHSHHRSVDSQLSAVWVLGTRGAVLLLQSGKTCHLQSHETAVLCSSSVMQLPLTAPRCLR